LAGCGLVQLSLLLLESGDGLAVASISGDRRLVWKRLTRRPDHELDDANDGCLGLVNATRQIGRTDAIVLVQNR
jgi:hypothetical protein